MKSHYMSKGYEFTKIGDTFLASIFDLPKSSTIRIKITCDYCLKEFERIYGDHIRRKDNEYSKKDCCKKCSPLKQKEVMLAKHGVESSSQMEGAGQKIRESKALPIETVRQEFENRGYTMLGEYINAHTLIDYICSKHKDEIQQISYSNLKHAGAGCPRCAAERVSGENSPHWNGGITQLNVYLRNRMRKWNEASLENGNYMCDITGSTENLDVHHSKNFSDISKEALDILNLPIYPNVTDYTRDELYRLVNTCNELHENYGHGIVLSSELHKEFHRIYGRRNNTPEQYIEFKNSKTRSDFG